MCILLRPTVLVGIAYKMTAVATLAGQVCLTLTCSMNLCHHMLRELSQLVNNGLCMWYGFTASKVMDVGGCHPSSEWDHG